MKQIKARLSIVCSLLFSSVIVFYGAGVSKPAIIWESPHIDQSSLIGTVTIREFSFTSSVALTNVDVRISPEIAPFVSVSPTHFESIEPGQANTIQFVFSISKDTPPETLQGSVHIRRGPSTIAKPLPVKIEVHPATLEEIPDAVAIPTDDRITVLPSERTIVFVKDELDIFLEDNFTVDIIKARVSELGGVFLGSSADVGFYQILIPDGDLDSLLNVSSELSAIPGVGLVTPHFFLSATRFPDDPGTDLSYGPDLVNLPRAWDLTTGERSVPVAVVDTVFDFNHVDLRNNISIHNPNTAPFGAPDHGTRVASIIAAKGNNGAGIAGVMWDASLHLYSAGKYNDSTGLDGALMTIAFSQAVQNGARVLNLSWDAHCEHKPCTPQGEAALRALDDNFIYFINLAKRKLPKDLFWVFAADNENANILTSSPARLALRFDNVAAISSVGSTRRLSSFSNYGNGVTVAAPGERIFSLVPGGGYDDGTFTIPIIGWKLDSYGSGTSYAAPYVAGVAGLMLSVNPGLTASQVKSIIRDTAERTGNLDPDGNEVSIINADRAVHAAVAGGSGANAYVANRGSNTVSAINTDTNTVVATIPVGSAPTAAVVNPAKTKVYVANGGDTVSVIDTATSSVEATVHLPPGSTPFGIAINPSGTRVFVTNFFGSTLSVIDTSTNTLVKTIPLGSSKAPEGVVVNPAGTRVYVACPGDATVSVINASTNIVVASITMSVTTVNDLTISSDGMRVYTLGGAINVIDTSTNTVVGAISVPGGLDSWGIVINADRSRLYASAFAGVVVINANNGTVITTIPISNNDPTGLAINTAGTRLYATNFSSDAVSVIDASTNLIISTIHVGDGPFTLGQFVR